MDLTTNLTWHRNLLSGLAWRMKPKCYIELGLPSTPVIYDVAQWCGMAYGVDIANSEPPDRENVTLFTMTTDRFFRDVASTLEPPELVFIDADHSRDQVLKDFAGVEAVCAENCVVVLHDTFPENRSFLAPELCNNSHECPEMIAWEHVTLPVPPGLTICRLRPRSMV